LEKFHLQKIINQESKIEQKSKLIEENSPLNFLKQFDLLDDGQVFEVMIQDSQNNLRNIQKIVN
jgi:hypothetical protein